MNEDLYFRTEVRAVNCKVEILDINVFTGEETLYTKVENQVFYISTSVNQLFVVS